MFSLRSERHILSISNDFYTQFQSDVLRTIQEALTSFCYLSKDDLLHAEKTLRPLYKQCILLETIAQNPENLSIIKQVKKTLEHALTLVYQGLMIRSSGYTNGLEKYMTIDISQLDSQPSGDIAVSHTDKKIDRAKKASSKRILHSENLQELKTALDNIAIHFWSNNKKHSIEKEATQISNEISKILSLKFHSEEINDEYQITFDNDQETHQKTKETIESITNNTDFFEETETEHKFPLWKRTNDNNNGTHGENTNILFEVPRTAPREEHEKLKKSMNELMDLQKKYNTNN